MNFKIELDREEDGRTIAEVIDLPGVLVYGKTEPEAIAPRTSIGIASNSRSSRAWRRGCWCRVKRQLNRPGAAT